MLLGSTLKLTLLPTLAVEALHCEANKRASLKGTKTFKDGTYPAEDHTHTLATLRLIQTFHERF